MPRLRAQERERAIGMLTAGMSAREVARRLHCCHSSVVRLQQRYLATGTTSDRPRSGQPRITTGGQDRCIRQLHLQNWFQPAAATSREIVGTRGFVSEHTVRRRLQTSGLTARRPYVGPILTRRHRQQRLQWAQQRQNWRRH